MKKALSAVIIIMCLFSCTGKKEVKNKNGTNVMDILSEIGAVGKLSMDGLVGNWILLDFNAEIDPSGDHLLINKNGNEYNAIFVYQGSLSRCVLVCDHGEYLLNSEKGERYKISRVESVNKIRNNGIGIDLLVGSGIENIDLGFFQREDILRELVNK